MRLHLPIHALAWLAVLMVAGAAHAAGTLTPQGSPAAPIEIRDHAVEVVIQDGFARTRVSQTFYNPNPTALEGLYAFPIPHDASLSEMEIASGETTIQGEVVTREEAERIYGAERDAGNDAGLANKEGIQRFEFRVANIPAQAEIRMAFVYYQPLEIDTGIGRYLYPLEDGGTDEEALSFWTTNEKVTRSFSIDLTLRSSVPVENVRTPGFEGMARTVRRGEGELHTRIESTQGELNRDFLFYYKLAEGQPARVDLVPYRPKADEPGHFMLVVTPGEDLAPLEQGADYIFVLDTSGSMAGKIGTLTSGVRKGIGELRPEDRFQIIGFSNRAYGVVGRFTPATPGNVQMALARVEALKAEGSTNMYEGLAMALDEADADRVTSIVLVTDGVTNTGIVDPRDFHSLVREKDVRIFGFLLGNSANWPLMRMVCDATGGFYKGVSNADDVVGQILLARSKITHAAMHDLELDFDGVRVFDTTGKSFRKVYRGQQLVLFGRYEGGGAGELDVELTVSGKTKRLGTRFEWPEIAHDVPEVERLFGLAHIQEIEDRRNAGITPAGQAAEEIADFGVRYQLVTDETSMLVLDDTAFDRHGIERRNRERTAVEHAAQIRRASTPVAPRRIDRQQPVWKGPAPGLGGGAFGPLHLLAVLALGVAARTAGRA